MKFTDKVVLAALMVAVSAAEFLGDETELRGRSRSYSSYSYSYSYGSSHHGGGNPVVGIISFCIFICIAICIQACKHHNKGEHHDDHYEQVDAHHGGGIIVQQQPGFPQQPGVYGQ